MLHLVQSNRMENLAEQLVGWLNRGLSMKTSIMQADVVLVQSPGMAQWLKLVIAQRLGIAANIDFPLPSSYIWQQYKQHIPALPEQSAYTKDNMTWKLMHLLPQLLDNEAFLVIGNYLADDNPLKRYQLCHKIADVFDQYLVYRPDWILAWEEGQNTLPDADVAEQPWQPILWRALKEYTQALGESAYHRANLHQSLLNTLQETQTDQSPLYVFGISAIPQQQLEVLSALAQSRDVIIFWLNPSYHYWADITDQKVRDKKRLAHSGEQADYLDVGNPLLSSWGKLGRDYQDVLIALDPIQHDEFETDFSPSILHTIQQEVLELTFRGANEELSPDELLGNGVAFPKIAIQPADRSLQVHVCHSKVRELEILRDNLLRLFNQDPSLSPGDIIVMMPDVASYAPLIEGVFGNAEKSHFIPYSISDRSAAEESGIVPTFLQLMRLHHSRVGLTDVLSIFTVPAVLEKFDVSENEAERVKHWLVESGVRWGWDGKDKSRWDLPDEGQNTWFFGLSRLISGYAQSSESMLSTGKDVIAPYAHIEGQEALALGKFYVFSRQLFRALAFCQQDSEIEVKVAGALGFVNGLYAESEDSLQDITLVRQAIESIAIHQSQFTEKITQDVFVAELEQKLNEKGVGQRFLAGYVNFCTLMPMRSIPFKHVCILGLNDGEYPRQTVPIGFDLMRSSPARKGDRSRRTDDRYLFLEAILSARSSLHLSYLGFSQKDNSPRSPSVLVNELLEYCGQVFCLHSEQQLTPDETQKKLLNQLVTDYPLQPFSERHYSAEHGHMVSFETQWFEVARQQRQEAEQALFSASALPKYTSHEPVNTIEIDDFITFFMNPAKAFFRSRWNASMLVRLSEFNDEEPFELDGLSRYKISQMLIENQQEKTQIQLQSQGILPVGNPGSMLLQKVQNESLKIVEQLRLLKGETSGIKQSVTAEVDSMQLAGVIDGLHSEELILWRPGKVRAKDKITLWLKLLLLRVGQQERNIAQGHFVGTDGCFTLPQMDRDLAVQQLTQFVDYWQRGLTAPLLCFPETAWCWLKTADEVKTLNQFNGSEFMKGEGQEPHIARVCPDLSAQFAEFVSQTETLYRPLFDYAENNK